jgi:transcriptional regulator with XRE-family HTH domain
MVVTRKLVQGFATNLRAHCNQKSSIAEICRATKIHRQQFNKYLSGNSFPNAHNLSKICNHLGITAEALFSTDGAKQTIVRVSAPLAFNTLENQSPAIKRNVPQYQNFGFDDYDNNHLAGSEQIQTGSYFCYFPFPGYEGFLLRTYMRVWNNAGRLSFSRVTRIRHPGEAGQLIAKGHHLGTVIQSTEEITFIGRNKQSPHQVSVINLERKSTFKDYYFGLALTRAAGNAMACRTALEYLGNIQPNRTIVSSLGIVQASNESVPKQIRLALFQKENFTQNLIFPPTPAEVFAFIVDQIP